MRVRVITLRYDEALLGFPEEAVRQACGQGELLEVREHFFVHGNVPHLACTPLLVLCSFRPAPALLAAGRNLVRACSIVVRMRRPYASIDSASVLWTLTDDAYGSRFPPVVLFSSRHRRIVWRYRAP